MLCWLDSTYCYFISCQQCPNYLTVTTGIDMNFEYRIFRVINLMRGHCDIIVDEIFALTACSIKLI